jgi:hypothetical protein
MRSKEKIIGPSEQEKEAIDQKVGNLATDEISVKKRVARRVVGVVLKLGLLTGGLVGVSEIRSASISITEIPEPTKTFIPTFRPTEIPSPTEVISEDTLTKIPTLTSTSAPTDTLHPTKTLQPIEPIQRTRLISQNVESRTSSIILRSPESMEKIKSPNSVSIEYLGSCKSEDVMTCSRWLVNGNMAEISGRGQMVGSGESPSVWTFGTFVEGSCKPERLQASCQTQEGNNIIWVNGN